MAEEEGKVLRPGHPALRPARVGSKRLALLSVLGAAAAALWGGQEAFVGTSVNRPAGRFILTSELPEGLTCRPAYGDRDGREEWDPYIQWRGEAAFRAKRELQADEHRQWYHFDAEGKVLGRLASVISLHLRGKESPLYDPYTDVGAFVVVTNCEKVRVSGTKYHTKLYFRNLSFRPGHMKVERFKDLLERFPERILMRAIWGFMPKTPSSRRIFKERLKLFVGPNHLYYDKDPVEYPMHLIKDCTAEMNMPKKRRMVYQKTVWARRMVEKVAADESKAEQSKLEAFKSFVEGQYNELGKEAVERMSMDELVQAAERKRIKGVLESNIGVQVPKKKVTTYLGTNIPKKKITFR